MKKRGFGKKGNTSSLLTEGANRGQKMRGLKLEGLVGEGQMKRKWGAWAKVGRRREHGFVIVKGRIRRRRRGESEGKGSHGMEESVKNVRSEKQRRQRRTNNGAAAGIWESKQKTRGGKPWNANTACNATTSSQQRG